MNRLYKGISRRAPFRVSGEGGGATASPYFKSAGGGGSRGGAKAERGDTEPGGRNISEVGWIASFGTGTTGAAPRIDDNSADASRRSKEGSVAGYELTCCEDNKPIVLNGGRTGAGGSRDSSGDGRCTGASDGSSRSSPDKSGSSCCAFDCRSAGTPRGFTTAR